MIQAVAIDDEPLALRVIESFCERSGEVALLKTFTRPMEGLNYLNKYPADLVFLDIQMPSITGMQLAKKLSPEILLIFTTAFDNFAVEGFNLNAIDYLLKPFAYERFLQAIEKVKKYRRPAAGSGAFITIRADYSLMRVPLDKIHYIEGLDDYLKIHLVDAKTIVARLTMKAMIELLPAQQFLRIHRSFIVPRSRITAVKRKFLWIGDLRLPIGGSYESGLEGLFGK